MAWFSWNLNGYQATGEYLAVPVTNSTSIVTMGTTDLEAKLTSLYIMIIMIIINSCCPLCRSKGLSRSYPSTSVRCQPPLGPRVDNIPSVWFLRREVSITDKFITLWVVSPQLPSALVEQPPIAWALACVSFCLASTLRPVRLGRPYQ
jgi:hypothetical protein